VAAIRGCERYLEALRRFAALGVYERRPNDILSDYLKTQEKGISNYRQIKDKYKFICVKVHLRRTTIQNQENRRSKSTSNFNISKFHI